MHDAETHEALVSFVGPRAPAIDGHQASVRDGIVFVGELGLLAPALEGPQSAIAEIAEAIGTIAQFDMAQAFSLWCHRMCIEYLSHAPADSVLRRDLLPELAAGHRLGSTAFAAGTAHYLAGSPLPVTHRRQGDAILLNGRIPWASNLEPPFVSVTATASEDEDLQPLVVAFTDETPGLRPMRYPDLLALQATASASPEFADAAVPPGHLVTDAFEPFVRAVLPAFLLLQSSFCWGLASRSLFEVGRRTGPDLDVFDDDYRRLRARFECSEADLRRLVRGLDSSLSIRDLLALRLEWGRLAVEAVALEAKLAGGRGYMARSETARRLREAAFLPIQAPTEAQLRWLLSRFQ